MLRRTLTALGFCLAASLALAGATPEEPAVPAVLQASDAEVKKLTEDVQKAVADKNDELLVKAIEQMETLRHDSFAPSIRAGLKSPNPAVLAASIRAAAAYEMKDIEKDIHKWLRAKPPKDDKVGLAGEVGAASIDYLTRLGLGGEDVTVVDSYLTPLVAPMDERRVGASWAADLMRASIHYIGKFKVKHGVPLLVELIAEPEPKAPSAGARGGAAPPAPPQSYWDARIKLWQKSESWVRWALKETTGQEFRSAREWAAWLKENGLDYR
jgi:hypothetical protein